MPREDQGSLGERLTLECREVPEAYGAVFACRSKPTAGRGKGEGQDHIGMSAQQGDNLTTRIVVEADGVHLVWSASEDTAYG
jgi:hypothetical protein